MEDPADTVNEATVDQEEDIVDGTNKTENKILLGTQKK